MDVNQSEIGLGRLLKRKKKLKEKKETTPFSNLYRTIWFILLRGNDIFWHSELYKNSLVCYTQVTVKESNSQKFKGLPQCSTET